MRSVHAILLAAVLVHGGQTLRFRGGQQPACQSVDETLHDGHGSDAVRRTGLRARAWPGAVLGPDRRCVGLRRSEGRLDDGDLKQFDRAT